MPHRRRSVRNIINYILVVMGIIALVLIWFTVDRFQKIVVSEQRNATAELAAHVVDAQLKTHKKYLIDLGLTMQAEQKFRRAFRERDLTRLHSLIADQFHQYFTTTGLVDLKRIVVYDADFNELTRTDSQPSDVTHTRICDSFLALAKSRKGVERNKSLTGLCEAQGVPYHIAITPIGGLAVTGYTLIVADPVNTLEQINNLPGMPFSIALPSGQVLFETSDWADTVNARKTLTASHTILGSNGAPLLKLNVAGDITGMSQRVSELMVQIFILALLVTALLVFLTRRLFNNRIVLPLMQLNQHMDSVQRNQDELGKSIELSGCKELDALSNSFNSMAKRLVEAQHELHNKAHTDALTGLPNREALYSRLEFLESQSNRTGKPFGLLMMDLNKFKQVNDNLGHHAGDDLIQQVAARLSDNLRASDTVARLGGDEFAVLLPTAERPEDAIKVSEKLAKVCAEPFIIEGQSVTIGASIGIAIYPDTADNGDYLMRCADKAMYQAKRSGIEYWICETHCGKQEVCHQKSNTIPLPSRSQFPTE